VHAWGKSLPGQNTDAGKKVNATGAKPLVLKSREGEETEVTKDGAVRKIKIHFYPLTAPARHETGHKAELTCPRTAETKRRHTPQGGYETQRQRTESNYKNDKGGPRFKEREGGPSPALSFLRQGKKTTTRVGAKKKMEILAKQRENLPQQNNISHNHKVGRNRGGGEGGGRSKRGPISRQTRSSHFVT